MPLSGAYFAERLDCIFDVERPSSLIPLPISSGEWETKRILEHIEKHLTEKNKNHHSTDKNQISEYMERLYEQIAKNKWD